MEIAKGVGAKGSIYHQNEALGTAHAVLCAADALQNEVIIAFADTLFKAEFDIDREKDGVIWVHKVKNPNQFGVVKVNKDMVITDFIEKPVEFVSDLAIIGIYYFKDGSNLRKELQYLIDNDIKEKGEYQLTNALENMKSKGLKFSPGQVEEWLDCGNKDATVYTNQRVLDIKRKEFVNDAARFNHGTRIIDPCYIGENVVIEESTIGPYVSLGDNTVIKNSVIENSIVQNACQIKGKKFKNSMIGNHVIMDGDSGEFSIGDYSVLQ
jgi:glucose-1-phosphate thymidylyltransferase